MLLVIVAPISKLTKSAVIEDWLRGLDRDQIAGRHDISGGSVSNIIRDWRAELDEGVADGDDFYTYMSEIYNLCTDSHYDPKKMVLYLNQIHTLSESIKMPIDQLPQYLSEQISNKEELSQEIEKLRVTISETKTRLDNLQEEADALQNELDQFNDLNNQLQKYGVEIPDLETLSKAVRELDAYGHDVKLIVSQIAEFQTLLTNKRELEKSVRRLGLKNNELETTNRSLLRRIGQKENELEAGKRAPLSRRFY